MDLSHQIGCQPFICGLHGVIMSKPIIIAVFGALLILCIGAQLVSVNDSDASLNVSKNYFNVH
jgi:hypothetical protein